MPWLVALVLLMQTLGLVHRVVHGPQAGFGPAAFAAGHAELAGPLQAPAPPHGLFAHLFGGHATDVDCRVFDQLSHGDGVAGVPLLALPLVFSAQVFQFFVGQALVRWAALFDARGPPLSSLR